MFRALLPATCGLRAVREHAGRKKTGGLARAILGAVWDPNKRLFVAGPLCYSLYIHCLGQRDSWDGPSYV